MGASFNKSIFSGRLTEDPQVGVLKNKKEVVNLNVAINEGYYDDKKNWVPITTYMKVEVYNGSVERVKNFKKGFEVLVEGKVRQKSYESDKNGTVKYHCVVLDSIRKLSEPKEKAAEGDAAGDGDSIPE